VRRTGFKDHKNACAKNKKRKKKKQEKRKKKQKKRKKAASDNSLWHYRGVLFSDKLATVHVQRATPDFCCHIALARMV
jgi:hypothetical protein